MSESQTLKLIVLPIFPMGSVVTEELPNRTQQVILPRLLGESEGALQWMVSTQTDSSESLAVAAVYQPIK